MFLFPSVHPCSCLNIASSLSAGADFDPLHELSLCLIEKDCDVTTGSIYSFGPDKLMLNKFVISIAKFTWSRPINIFCVPQKYNCSFTVTGRFVTLSTRMVRQKYFCLVGSSKLICY